MPGNLEHFEVAGFASYMCDLRVCLKIGLNIYIYIHIIYI